MSLDDRKTLAELFDVAPFSLAREVVRLREKLQYAESLIKEHLPPFAPVCGEGGRLPCTEIRAIRKVYLEACTMGECEFVDDVAQKLEDGKKLSQEEENILDRIHEKVCKET